MNKMSKNCQFVNVVNMADDAAARREARRKRILENSHNRLQLISGKNNDESCKESHKSPRSQHYEARIETDSNLASSYAVPNGIPEIELQTFESLSSRHDIVAAGDGELVNDLAAFGPSTAPEQIQPPLWTTLISYKYDVVFLSLFIQILHGVSSVDFENTYFFFPLIIYTVTKVLWFPNQSNSGIANVLLLLNGMNPSKIQKIVKIVQVTGTISQDISIYLFITICTQSLYCTLRDSFVT